MWETRFLVRLPDVGHLAPSAAETELITALRDARTPHIHSDTQTRWWAHHEHIYIYSRSSWPRRPQRLVTWDSPPVSWKWRNPLNKNLPFVKNVLTAFVKQIFETMDYCSQLHLQPQCFVSLHITVSRSHNHNPNIDSIIKNKALLVVRDDIVQQHADGILSVLLCPAFCLPAHSVLLAHHRESAMNENAPNLPDRRDITGIVWASHKKICIRKSCVSAVEHLKTEQIMFKRLPGVRSRSTCGHGHSNFRISFLIIWSWRQKDVTQQRSKVMLKGSLLTCCVYTSTPDTALPSTHLTPTLTPTHSCSQRKRAS